MTKLKFFTAHSAGNTESIAKTMLKKLCIASINMKQNILILATLFFSFIFFGCSSGKNHSDVSNPFVGKWESNIPSMNAKMLAEYSIDGTFTCTFPNLPVEQGGGAVYTGAYLLTGNVMVTWLDLEGAGAYLFKVVDADTLYVTEIDKVENGGEKILGSTATFIRIKK